MKWAPKVGAVGQVHFVVGEGDVIDFATGGMPAVLSTPRLIGYLERTAREVLAPGLEEEERTVGTEIEIEHLAPAGLGAEVTCQARVVHVAGRSISFAVEARDEIEVLAKGFHRRHVVRVDQLARRLNRKASVRVPTR